MHVGKYGNGIDLCSVDCPITRNRKHTWSYMHGEGIGFPGRKKEWFMVSWIDHAGTLTATLSPIPNAILDQTTQELVLDKLLAAPSALGPKAIPNFAPSDLVP